MSDPRIALLRGGPSDEYDVSMRTGAAVLKSLLNQGYQVKDIIISKDGEWLEEGRVKTPDQVFEGVDRVFIGLHGAYAEDGEVQKILQRMNLPFTGSRSLPSAIAFNKRLTKDTLRNHGITMPHHVEIDKNLDTNLLQIVADIKSSFGPEYIIKPVANGSSIGMRLVHEGQSLYDILSEMLQQYDRLLVEEFIRGKEGTGAVIEDFRNQSIYAFPSLEIVIPRNTPFFTNDAKYSGETEVFCPSRFSYAERSAIAEVSTQVHEILNLSQYSRSDFIIRDGKVYFLEVNTLPGLTSESLFPKAAASVGVDFDELIAHLIQTAKM